MQKYDLSKILRSKRIVDITNEEWGFLNSLNFDVLFEENGSH